MEPKPKRGGRGTVGRSEPYIEDRRLPAGMKKRATLVNSWSNESLN